MDSPVQSAKLNVVSFGHLHRAARPILARNLWVLGYPDQALVMAAEAVREADALNRPFAICYVIMSCVVVALDNGDWQRAEELTHRMSSVAAKHHLLTYARAAGGWQGRLAISRGDLARGIELLQTALAALHEDGYELYRPQFSASLAEGLAKAGQLELASSTICEAVTWAESRGRILNFIDSLRVKGEILNLAMSADTSEGETCLVKSLHLAHERGLQELEATFITVTEALAVAQATAIFTDGRRFTESGDATPDNVHFDVRSHFARLALTRAKARALRDALNIGMCAVEELE